MLVEIEQFVNWVRRRSPEARTWKDYGYDLRFFVQVVGDRPLHEITFRDIDQFIAIQSEKGFKPSTINRRLASVITLYRILFDGGRRTGLSRHYSQTSSARTPEAAAPGAGTGPKTFLRGDQRCA